MKRITFFCLLLLSASLMAEARTTTINKTMNLGSTIQVKPYQDSQAYLFGQIHTEQTSVSDNSIISVTSYQESTNPLHFSYYITAVNPGYATFTVTQHVYGLSEEYIVIYVIHVIDPNNIPVTSISLNQSDCNLCVGGTQQLSATIKPTNATNKTVSWQTNNFNVATVNSNGLVTGVAPGQTLITATTQDGTNLTASCVFNVKVAPTDIQLNHESYQFRQLSSEKLQLEATILPAEAHQEVQWTSSNENVASVDASGLVTPKYKGEAIITATTTDGSNLSATCTITVLPALATAIELNKTSASLKVGQTLQLSALVSPYTVYPNNHVTYYASQEVEWTSSNVSVATVDENGLVTAMSLGDATITATTKDGTNLSASCAVTVVPEFASGISLNQSSVNLHFGESSQLVATITPNNAPQDVVWTSSDPSVVSVDEDGFLYANSLGQATITATSIATTTNGTNLTATCNVNVVKRYFCDNDVNQDGVVTAADITALYNFLLNNDMTYITTIDVNDDGLATAADITSVYNELLNDTGGNNDDDAMTFNVNGVIFKMIKVEGGTFTMGATPEQGNEARQDEKPAHNVTLSTFYICQTEVTQELWQAVMGSNPSPYNGTKLPVSNISWDNCQEFISNLNQITGKTFRLPTEAEWEYAARGGNKSQGYKYAGSNNVDEVAWYSSNTTHTVATKMPNELGLYDMSGNVWEWCQDWYNAFYYIMSPSTNPTGPSSGTKHVGRGGGVGFTATGCRVAYRDSNGPDADDGMRLVMNAE